MRNILFAAILIILDRVSKYLAAAFLSGSAGRVIIPGILGLRYTENTGAAFSMLSGKRVFLVAVTSAALLIIAYFLFVKKRGDKAERLCFLLVFAGGVGNLIDRIFQGYVIDYFEFLFMDFAVFNVADVYVTVGVALYAAYVLYTEIYSKKRDNR